MSHDDQISVCLDLKTDLILSSGFDIMIDEKDTSTDEIKRELEVSLEEDTDRSLTEMLSEVLFSGEMAGFALSEKLFWQRDDGKIALKDIKTRHPATWLIYLDKKGNVEKYVQQTASGDIEIKPTALIHYINNAKWGNYYGNSALRNCYDAWFIKRQIIRYYAIFLEKNAAPIPVARYDTNAPESAVDKIFNSIKNFQSKTALAIPKEIEMTFLEAKSSGESYTKAINLMNMHIGRSLLIPDLLGFQGSETSGGSYSLGKEQMNVFFKHIHKKRKIIEDLVNNEILKPMIIANYGLVDKFPKFRLRPVQEDDALEMAKTWLDAVKGKVYKPTEEEINYFRDTVKFPQGAVEFVEQQSQTPFGESKKPLEEKEEIKPIDTEDKSEDKPIIDEPKKEYKKLYDQTPGEFHKRVDFKAMESTMDRTKNKIMAESKPVVKKILDDLVDQIEKKKIIQNTKPERMDSIKLKYLKELQIIFKSAFRELFKEAQGQAQSEIFKHNFKTILPTQEFLDVFEQDTYNYIGDWEYSITKKAKQAMSAAMKDGTPLNSVIDIITKEGLADSEASIERYARTKTTELLNRARKDYFDKSGVVSGYQYSAIIDDRVSEICSSLHGKIFSNKAGEVPTPPLHFNAILENSLIETNYGNKKINQIEVNDLVLTHTGLFKKVTEVMNKFEDKEYFEITLQNGKIINITAEHPILTKRGWVRVDQLSILDDIICREDILNER
jgi:SPP1 gp7 family putative phage head morphogenesis protein